MRILYFCLTLCLGFFISSFAIAKDVNVAVAANFTAAGKEIAQKFYEKTGLKARMSFGSTGKLYAQIINGAPFDVFLAADAERPIKLENEGRIVEGTRFIYATGGLVLWSFKEGLVTGDISILETGDFNRLAIANPKTAPYGIAALEILQQNDIYQRVKNKIVQGNNIAQTLQFVASENVDLGFIAASQAAKLENGSRWNVPSEMHIPLVQEAVVLRSAKNMAAAEKFMEFLSSSAANEIKSKYKYGY